MKPNFILFIILYTVFTVNVHATRDDLATTIDLRGIPGPYSFHGVCRLNTPEMWTVGGNGQINYRSVNRSREFHPTEQDLYGVFFSSSNVGWVVGTSGIILHTQDAGEHWAEQNSGVKNDLNAITCLNESDCWIAGASGTILRTNNRGENWVKVSVDSSVNLNALHFINSQVGWAAGKAGLILHTDDGGSTWTQQYLKMIEHPDSQFASPADLEAVLEHPGSRGKL